VGHKTLTQSINPGVHVKDVIGYIVDSLILIVMYKFSQIICSSSHCYVIILQMIDVFDGNRLIVGPYNWSDYTFLTQYIRYPDEYFRKVEL